MAEYKHGALGNVNATGARASGSSGSKIAIVYIGTAPVHTVENGAKNVNTPMLINDISEAKKYLGYSEDWASYTLCEPIHHHFETKGVGPLVFINVFDPEKCKASEKGNISKKPENGRITIPAAESIILDSVEVKTTGSGAAAKVKGKDYTISYSSERKAITIAEISSGALGTETLAITYDSVDPSKVTTDDVIGSSDGLGLNTGIFAVKNVYPVVKYIPGYLLAPGFASIPAVHSVLYQNSKKINGHWDAYVFSELPLVNNTTPITFDTAHTFKNGNGYTNEGETAYFPLAKGTDGHIYHISVIAAANFQELLIESEGIPYRSASNTEAAIIENLYMGEDNAGRIFDDEIINKKLNQYGIASAAYVGGRWAIWGAHCADYNYETDPKSIGVAETNRMMMYYLSNNFQSRRSLDVDQPLSPNDIKTIVSEEQARLDALVNSGMLAYGTARLNSDMDAKSDILTGDYCFDFEATAIPLSKSLLARVSWTDDGFVTYFSDGSEE